MVVIKNPMNKILIPIVLLCILIFLFKSRVFLSTTPIDSKANELVSAGVIAASSAPKLQRENLNNAHAKLAENIETQWSPVMRNEANRAEIIKWFALRGNYDFYGPDERDDYQGYDLETLKNLSHTGDLRAMHMLANKQDNLPSKKFLLQQAAVYGSTAALAQMGSLIEVEEDFFNKSEKERRPYEIEALAYYEAAKLRGDRWSQISDSDSLLRRYPTELTQQDRQRIRTRGREIYDFYQQGRDILGLGEFDNSVPDIVNQFFDETASNRCNKKYNPRPSPYLCGSD